MIYRIVCVILFSYCVISCAKIVSPTGGDKDETPPKILESLPLSGSASIDPNKDNTIEIEFDEYVVLDNPNDVLISPYMEERPEIKLKGKKLLIEFKDSLEKDITYTIDFGNKIKDLNEKNPMENFKFVFATGEQVDSSKISGTATYVSDTKPAKDVWVGLYKINQADNDNQDNTNDSLFFKQPPLYIAKADDKGKYSLNNIADGNYELVALEDKNYNLYFDLPNERIAFVDTTIVVKRDSMPDSQIHNLEMFEENASVKVLSTKNQYRGKTQIELTEKIKKLDYEFVGNESLKDSTKVEENEDPKFLTLWYFYADTSQHDIVFYNGETMIDTIGILPNRNKRPEIDSLQMSKVPDEQGGILINADADLIFTFNYLIENINTDDLKLIQDDSIEIKKDSINAEIEFNKVKIEHSWKTDSKYSFSWPSQNINDIYGRMNMDSIQLNFTVQPAREKGSLLLKLTKDSLNTTDYNYIYKLNLQSTLIDEGTYTNDSLLVEELLPGKYDLQIIEDRNNNSQWDAGEYVSRRLSEKIIRYPQSIEIKGNWQTDIEVKVDD